MKSVMNQLVASLLVAFLYGCGGGGTVGSDLNADPVVLTAGNESVRLERTDRYSLSIASSGNRVTFAGASRLDSLLVDGTANTVVLESGASATSIEISGANNNVTLDDHVAA